MVSFHDDHEIASSGRGRDRCCYDGNDDNDGGGAPRGGVANQAGADQAKTCAAQAGSQARPARSQTGTEAAAARHHHGVRADLRNHVARERPRPKPGETVLVHYTGTLTDGTKFHSSQDRKEPIAFPLGRSSGDQRLGSEGMAQLGIGDSAVLIVPPRWGTARRAPAASFHRTRRWCSWSRWST